MMAMKVISLLCLLCLVSGCDPLQKTVLLSNDGEESQGILGIVRIYPGACLVDPFQPGECLNKPFAGAGTFDIRLFADSPDPGERHPILKTFTSQNDGWFQVELPVGRYCIWSMNVCQAQVDIEAGKWVLITLGVFLP